MEELASRGLSVLAVDCDPNPNLAESFGIDSREVPRFDASGLRRAGDTLALERAPQLLAVEFGASLLGGPPSAAPLADAVARGIAGVLLGNQFDAVVTDLGAGPEFTEMAVGGALNPADVCVVVTNGTAVTDLSAERIVGACRRRGVPTMQVVLDPGAPSSTAGGVVDRLVDDRSRPGM